jgi:N-acetylneuraminic acid mutarotase
MDKIMQVTIASVISTIVIVGCATGLSPTILNARLQEIQYCSARVSAHDKLPVGKWSKRKPMNIGAVFAATTLGLDGKIYVISGSTGYDVNLSAAVQVYDPRRDSWSQASPIPTPRTSAGSAVGPDGKIYVIGGQDAERRMNVVEAYDPAKDRWTSLAPLPTPRDATQAVAAKGADGRVLIYVMGGRGPLHDRKRENYSTVEAFDPEVGTWSTKAPMPTRRHAHAATLGPDGRIYVIGGTNRDRFACDTLEIYDPKKDTWTTGAPMPYGQECAAATCAPGPHGEVLVFGGWTKDKIPVRNAVAYNPRTSTWRSLPALQTARAACGAITIATKDGFRTFVIGGTGEDGSNKVHPGGSIETSVSVYTTM